MYLQSEALSFYLSLFQACVFWKVYFQRNGTRYGLIWTFLLEGFPRLPCQSEEVGGSRRESRARNSHSCWVMGLGQSPPLPFSIASTEEWSLLNKRRVDWTTGQKGRNLSEAPVPTHWAIWRYWWLKVTFISSCLRFVIEPAPTSRRLLRKCSFHACNI